MKIYFLLIIAFLFHGENTAIYTITKDGSKIHITAKLDASDMLKAIGSDADALKKELLNNYLIEHMEYKINDKQTSFVLNSFELDHHHLIINISLVEEFETISKLQIKNTALFEVNNKQSNVIELRFDGMFRDFLINKDKPVLDITF